MGGGYDDLDLHRQDSQKEQRARRRRKTAKGHKERRTDKIKANVACTPPEVGLNQRRPPYKT